MKSISGYCLVDLYVQSKVYIGLVNENAKEVNAFYFKPNCKNFSFDKVPVCINTLNSILPEMCEKAGLKRKTAHSLRVACASSLFNAGVDAKFIRDRTGHKYNALKKYKKGNELNLEIVSGLFGPNANKAKAAVLRLFLINIFIRTHHVTFQIIHHQNFDNYTHVCYIFFFAYKLTTELYYNFSLHRFTLIVRFTNEPEPRIDMHLSVVTLRV